jgi:hypothetical protein
MKMRKWGKRVKREGPPTVSERPPGPQRRFRKTVGEVAHEIKERLALLGVESTVEEVEQVVRGQAPASIVTTLVEAFVSDERNRGVEIV